MESRESSNVVLVWGGNDMRNLAKILVMFAVCLAATSSVSAIDMTKPYVAVSIPKKPLYLGEVWGPGVKEVGAELTAHVVANCPYTIMASFEGLRHQKSHTKISAQDMTVAINGKEVPVGAKRVPVAVQGRTPRSGVRVPIDLQVGVTGLTTYPAGRYAGTLVITVMPGF